MSQRQKKRSSQARKRYHDSVKKEGASGKPPPPHQKQNFGSQVKSSSSEGSKSTSSHSAQKQVVEAERKSYSKRKVTSNWSRYDEGDSVADLDEHVGTDTSLYLRTSETEEELKLRLLQLLNLPRATASVPLTGLVEDCSLLESQVNPQFITLDCQSLAESLSTLPVHERLDISEELLELSGYKNDLDGSIDKLTGGRDELSSKQDFNDPGLMSKNANVELKDTYNIGVQDAPEIGVVECKDDDFKFKTQLTAREENSTVENTDLLSNTELGDAELDQLLQNSTAIVDTGDVLNKQDVVNNEQYMPSPVGVHDTDELDDMLDELLLT